MGHSGSAVDDLVVSCPGGGLSQEAVIREAVMLVNRMDQFIVPFPITSEIEETYLAYMSRH